MHQVCVQTEEIETLKRANSELEKSSGAISSDVKWLIKIGYGVFSVGLAVVAVGLAAIFYAGGITQTLQTHTAAIEKLERRIERIEEVLWAK